MIFSKLITRLYLMLEPTSTVVIVANRAKSGVLGIATDIPVSFEKNETRLD